MDPAKRRLYDQFCIYYPTGLIFETLPHPLQNNIHRFGDEGLRINGESLVEQNETKQ